LPPIDDVEIVVGEPTPLLLGLALELLPVAFDSIPVHDALLSFHVGDQQRSPGQRSHWRSGRMVATIGRPSDDGRRRASTSRVLVRLEDAADDNASGKHVEVIVIPLAGRVAGRCAFRISEDMELACCNASARSTALSEPNDELSVITTNRSVSFPESAAPPPCSKGGGISLTQKCGRQTNAESEISFKRTSKTVAALV